MIARRIDRKPGVSDNFTRLGQYVAAAREEGEKLDRCWISNCDAGAELADLDTALIEAEATRAFSGSDNKTYHMVVSFRHGDKEKLSAEDLKEIERAYAEALGFGDHQRVTATHINTDNFHMHIAINKVHPVTHHCRWPYRDNYTLDRVSRALEQRFGLAIDRGIGDARGKNGLSGRARDYEAKTWRRSFEGHLLDHKADIKEAMEKATSWGELHQSLADFDIEFRKRGAGLAAYQIAGKRRAKASSIDRSCSLKTLETRLGPFEAAPAREAPGKGAAAGSTSLSPPKRPYQGRPLTSHPGTARLWRQFAGTKKPGFLSRNFLNLGSWRDYLMADAMKDPLAMAIIISYKEFLHSLDEMIPDPSPQYRPTNSVRPVLEHWYKATSWKQPAVKGLDLDFEEVGLKTDQAGRVVFPLKDADGHIWALRAVDGRGRVCDIGDVAARPDLACIIDPDGQLLKPKPRGPVIVTADPVAALALHKDRQATVVLVAREKDLIDRVRALRRRQPDAAVIVVAGQESKTALKTAAVMGSQFQVLDTEQVVASWAEAKAPKKSRPGTAGRDMAADMGAFVEDALTLEEALASSKRSAAAPDPSRRGGASAARNNVPGPKPDFTRER